MHKLSERNVFEDNLFLAKFAFFLKETTIAKFLQEKKKCCKIVARILQDYFLQDYCKSCIDCKNFARFLQKLFFL